MMFLNRICTICMFILLTTYSTNSYKWRTKELGNNTNFPLNYSPLRRLIEPLNYEIYLDTISKDYTFKGYINIFFIIEYPTMQINLNAYELNPEEYIHFYRYPYVDSYNIINSPYVNQKESLILSFNTEIPSGLYTMQMAYIGFTTEKEVGLYRTTCKNCTGALEQILVTQLKPNAARRVFPCWDDPVFRTRFDIEIQHYRDYISLSNMPIQKQLTISDNVMWTKFHSTPPIPANLVAFVLMDFVCSSNDQVNFTTRVCSTSLVKQEQMTFALNTSVYVTTYMHNYTRMSSQLREITHIGLRDFSYEAAGNWGFNIYRENYLIYNETLHPIEHKLDVWMYMSSLVALQWVGNLVSPTSWTHMWFSQTLALFYAVKAVNQMYDDKDITSLFTYRLQSLASEEDAVSQVKLLMYPIRNNHDEINRLIKSSHFTNCLKEYAIITMLEYVVTESIFRNATTTYLEKYQFSTATPNDFWDILQDMIEEKEIFPTHPSIAQVMQSWLKQGSLPVITVTRNHTKSNISIVIMLSQNGTENDNNNNNLWIPINYMVPINYITKLNLQYRVSRTEWLHSTNRQFVFRGIFDYEWVIVNWQNTGYYRVEYDYWSWEVFFTKILKSENRTRINVFNRAHMIEDAYYFWKEKKLNINTFLNLIYSMWYEEQCAPWYAMQNTIKKMWRFLNIDAGKSIKSAIVDVLGQLLKKVGYTEHSNDTECIKFKRLLAMKWACRLLHPPCLEIAQERLLEHLEDLEINIISPMWEEWTYCNGLVLSKVPTWSRVFAEYKRTKNKRILKYLACSTDISIMRNYLDIAMSNNALIMKGLLLNSEDRQQIYRWIIKKHISNNELLNFALENIKQMKINDEFIKKISYIIENVYSKSQMEEIKLFLHKDIHLNSAQYNILTFKLENQQLRITKLEQIANETI